MRHGQRRRGWFAGSAGLALIFILGQLSIAPARGAPAPSQLATASPSASPSPSQSPSATAETGCQEPFAYGDPDQVVRGTAVRVRYEDFHADASVTLLLSDLLGLPPVDRPIGTGVADAQGNGAVEGEIPQDALIGDNQVQVVSDRCLAYASIVVLGTPEAVSVDDDTVNPGQRVTLQAGGFHPNDDVHVSIDSFPTQGECWPRPCLFLGSAATSDVGSAVIRVQIPPGTTPGRHRLWVSGYMADGIREDSLGVDIVVGPGTLPPTDTASG